MRKVHLKTVYLLSLCMALMLTACGSRSFEGETNGTRQMNDKESEDSLAETKKDEERTVESGGNSSTEAKDMSADERQSDRSDTEKSRWILFDADDLKLELIAAKDIDTFGDLYVLKCSYELENKTSVALKNVVIGEWRCASEALYWKSFEGKGTYYCVLDRNFVKGVNEAKKTGEIPISYTVFVKAEKSGEEKEEEYSEDGKICLPADLQTSLVIEPCLDALAEEQVLLENETARVTILGMGLLMKKDLGEFSFTEGELSLVMEVENKGAEDLQFLLSGVALNGVYFAQDEEQTVRPGMKIYVYIECDKLNKQEITSIADCSLMLYCGKKNWRANQQGEGNWYPVELAEHGTYAAYSPEGEVVYDANGLVITCVELKKEDRFDKDDDDRYSWRLFVDNRSDNNLDLQMNECYVNGKKQDRNFYFSANGFGADTGRFVTVTYEVPQSDPIPELSFTMRVKKQGGDAILYTVEDPIVLPVTPTEESSE